MTPPNFSPAIPNPLVVDPKDRIEDLKSLLSEERWKYQKANITKLIHMYETRELGPLEPGTETWLCDWKVLDREPAPYEVPQGSVLWCEVCIFSFVLSYHFAYSESRELVHRGCRVVLHRYHLMTTSRSCHDFLVVDSFYRLGRSVPLVDF